LSFTGYNEFVNTNHHPGIEEPLRIADDPALDFLNTTVVENGTLIDRLQSDADVLRWLAAMGFDAPRNVPFKAGALLKTARSVRENLRTAIEQKKAGKPFNTRYWNALLAKAPAHLAITQGEGDAHTERLWQRDTPEQVLGPLLESAVDLLVSGDFNLIRHCEDSSCVLWFYDRTKSHRRRWCSMSTCGNRNKVAAFRERQQAGG
jgi:predicted RNA-binding Zn ribbon-like protein